MGWLTSGVTGLKAVFFQELDSEVEFWGLTFLQSKNPSFGREK